MILQYKTHKAITIQEPGFYVLMTTSPTAYRDWILGLSQQDELIKVMKDDYEDAVFHHVVDWTGDLLLTDHIVDRYLAKVITTYTATLAEDRRNMIFQKWHDLYQELQTSLYMENLPLEIDFDTDLKKLLKLGDLHFDQKFCHQPYGIIETILQIHQNCGLSSAVATCNLANYLAPDQLNELTKVTKQMSQILFSVEFKDSKSNIGFENAHVYYIDEDLVDWY